MASDPTLFDGAFNLNAFGAIGDGVTDCSTAITNAIAASVATKSKASNSTMSWAFEQRAVFVPPGHYIFDAAAITQVGGNVILVSVPRTSVIEIVNSQYLLAPGGNVANTYVKGLHILGGLGFAHYTNTSNNVGGQHIFEDCYFDNYTQCGVGNEATDMPYFRFLRCMFKGTSSGGTFGVALGGFLDSLWIESTSFLADKYCMKIGPRIGGSAHFVNLDLTRFTSGIRSADFWFVPNEDSSDFYNNSGQGSTITKTKFGDENLLNTDTRILVAIEDTGSGSNRVTYQPLLSYQNAAASAWISGIHVEECRLSGVGSQMSAPFLTSYVNNLDGFTWKNNNVDGGPYTYCLQFMGSWTGDYTNTNNMVDLSTTQISPGQGQVFATAVSNFPSAIVQDRTGKAQGTPNVLLSSESVGDDISYLPFGVTFTYAGITAFGGGTTKSQVTDGLGGSNAALVTAGAINLGAFINLSNVTEGTLCYIDLDLKQGSGGSCTAVQVYCKNTADNRKAGVRVIPLQSSWRTVRIPFTLPVSANSADWQFIVQANDYALGTGDKFTVAFPTVYAAFQPMNRTHLRTIGSGLYDGAHFILNTRHLWLSQGGTLRSKSSAPTSSSDGMEPGGGTNGIRNTVGTGFAAGSPGTLPTNWSTTINVAGLTVTLNSIGYEQGGNYMEFRVNGTPGASGFFHLNFEANNYAQALPSEQWYASLGVALVAGSLTNVTNLGVAMQAVTGGGAFINAVNSFGSPTGTRLNIDCYYTNTPATTAFVQPLLTFSVTNGQAIDLTLRVYDPVMKQVY